MLISGKALLIKVKKTVEFKFGIAEKDNRVIG
jgi:hypothetical protein